MDNNEKYRYWLDIAEYDLATAEDMNRSARWLYVAFMCQQAIEKLVKGLYVLYVDEDVPRVHNISQVINKYADQLSEDVLESYYVLFEKLTSFYIAGRYPKYKDTVSQLLDKKEAEGLLKQTKEVFAWLLTMKPSIGQ